MATNFQDVTRWLLSHYYGAENPSESLTSSHWARWSQEFHIRTDEAGNLLSLRGSSFGDGRWVSASHRRFDRLAMALHLLHIPHRSRVLARYRDLIALCRSLELDPTFDFFRQACTLAFLEAHLPETLRDRPLRVLMIGDGFGVLAALFKKRFPKARVTLVDLGKTLLFQSYYCGKAHPRAVPQVIGAGAISETADFTFCPAETLSAIGGQEFDLAVNVVSMQEMHPDVIAQYFQFLRRALGSDHLFYCCNRLHKRLPGGEVTELYKYPWVPGDTHLVDEPCPWHRYFLSNHPSPRRAMLLGRRIPFVNLYDGPISHRLSVLARA